MGNIEEYFEEKGYNNMSVSDLNEALDGYYFAFSELTPIAENIEGDIPSEKVQNADTEQLWIKQVINKLEVLIANKGK